MRALAYLLFACAAIAQAIAAPTLTSSELLNLALVSFVILRAYNANQKHGAVYLGTWAHRACLLNTVVVSCR